MYGVQVSHSKAVEAPVKFQSNMTVSITILAVPKHNEIWWYAALLLSE